MNAAWVCLVAATWIPLSEGQVITPAPGAREGEPCTLPNDDGIDEILPGQVFCCCSDMAAALCRDGLANVYIGDDGLPVISYPDAGGDA